MQPQYIFDAVLARVRELQALQGAIPAVRGDGGSHGGPARVGNPGTEYIAEFARAGARVLIRKDSKGQPIPGVKTRKLQVFDLYFVEGVPYQEAIKTLHVKPGTVDRWFYEIKRLVGNELARCGLYPVSQYGRRTATWRTKQ
jgi:hypothetical protein